MEDGVDLGHQKLCHHCIARLKLTPSPKSSSLHNSFVSPTAAGCSWVGMGGGGIVSVVDEGVNC